MNASTTFFDKLAFQNLNYWSIVSVFIAPAIVFLGIGGNLLIVLVMPRAAVSVSRSTRLYYTCIGIGDLSFLTHHLFCTILSDGLYYWTGGAFAFYILGQKWTCRAVSYTFWSSEAFTNNLYACFAIERTIAVYRPFYAMQKLTITLTRCLIVGSAVWALICNSLVLMNYEPLQFGALVGYACQSDPAFQPFQVIYMFDYALFNNLVSITITAACNTAIARSLVKASSKRTELTNLPTSGPAAAGKMSKREISTAVTLIVLSTIHVVLYFPESWIWLVYGFLAATDVLVKNVQVYLLIGNLAWLSIALCISAHALNLWVYLARMVSFRHELFTLLTCREADSDTSQASKSFTDDDAA